MVGIYLQRGSGSEWLRGSEKLERGSSFTEVERAGGRGKGRWWGWFGVGGWGGGLNLEMEGSVEALTPLLVSCGRHSEPHTALVVPVAVGKGGGNHLSITSSTLHTVLNCTLAWTT